ncbi:DUF6083 domain-containing protein [Streptomyces sp. NPDC053513]|uniref:DUF6083 domain-containing protein n=1 Tax=unclassified Streptomyces TaxID=2593676 RepID=UPI0037D713AA
MSLCAECEQAGAAHPTRDPVLVGEVLAGLADAMPRGARVVAQRARPGDVVRDLFGPGSAARDGAGPGSRPPGVRAPVLAACDRCGAGAEWHRTARGRWVLIEPGELTAGLVPVGRRWRVGGDGTAANLGAAVPADRCRVSHFDVCPARPAPDGSPVLLALWQSHARRTA